MKFGLIFALAASIAAVVVIARRQQAPPLPTADIGTWTPIPSHS